jgi:uncharacterized membrane protein
VGILNPFALPLHPAVVHFPVAMLTATWVCLLVRYLTGRLEWDRRADLFEVVGVLSLPVAMATAVIDARGLGFFFRPRWDAPLIWHALAGLAGAAIFAGHLRWRRRRSGELVGRQAVIDLAVVSAGLWCLLVIGLLGGEMVFAR